MYILKSGSAGSDSLDCSFVHLLEERVRASTHFLNIQTLHDIVKKSRKNERTPQISKFKVWNNKDSCKENRCTVEAAVVQVNKIVDSV
jgi:hypothetical protein